MDSKNIEIKSEGTKAHLFLDEHEGQLIKKWISEDLHKSVNDIKTAIFDEGKREFLNKIPA